jgi:hypothetical protein
MMMTTTATTLSLLTPLLVNCQITVSEFGSCTGDSQIMAEIQARGPVSCYIDAGPLEVRKGSRHKPVCEPVLGRKGRDSGVRSARFGCAHRLWGARARFGWAAPGWRDGPLPAGPAVALALPSFPYGL